MDNLYTKKRSAQYRGPSTSDDYNARIEENYKDLMHLVNRLGIAQENIARSNRAVLKNLLAITSGTSALGGIIGVLLSGLADDKRIVYTGRDLAEDTGRFDGTAFEVAESERCTITGKHLTLPLIEQSSSSKLKFEDENGSVFLPSTFEAYAVGVNESIDNASAFVNTSDVANAIVGNIDNVWERTVVVDSVTPGVTEAIVELFIRIPEDVSTISDSNYLTITPFPLVSVTILDISVTETPNPLLRDSDGYTPLNADSLYISDGLASSYLPPSLSDNVSSINQNMGQYYFDPRPITAVKITLSQNGYIREGDNSYIFTYGASDIDIRYNKYLDTGKIIYRIDALDGQTISNEYDLEPKIFNVSLADIPYVFSQRAIWETSPDSGVYTTTPVPFSDRYWIEVTLNKTPGGGTPSLTHLFLN